MFDIELEEHLKDLRAINEEWPKFSLFLKLAGSNSAWLNNTDITMLISLRKKSKIKQHRQSLST
jgi:hypothetical protein